MAIGAILGSLIAVEPRRMGLRADRAAAGLALAAVALRLCATPDRGLDHAVAQAPGEGAVFFRRAADRLSA